MWIEYWAHLSRDGDGKTVITWQPETLQQALDGAALQGMHDFFETYKQEKPTMTTHVNRAKDIEAQLNRLIEDLQHVIDAPEMSTAKDGARFQVQVASSALLVAKQQVRSAANRLAAVEQGQSGDG